jgi:hypothetical protein
MNVTINESSVSVPEGVATWGELLDWLETGYFKRGQCITKVAVDGEEDIDYRSATACDQALTTVGQIRIESSDFDLVLRESFGEIEQGITAAIETANGVIGLFESRNDSEAYSALAKLLDAARIFFAVFSEDLGWVDPENVEIPRSAIPAALERALTQVISAQESRSWLLLCDIIQYELIPILESWKSTVAATRAAAN